MRLPVYVFPAGQRETTYGLERIAMYLQEVIMFNSVVQGINMEIHHKMKVEFSKLKQFDACEKESIKPTG
jgi:glycyl-tRNA synthetase alpha subunit